jgi:hypothetical protein
VTANGLRADDRVLLVSVLPVQEMAALARILMRGSLLVLGNRDEVDEGRRHLSEFDNVMFVEGDPDHVPWRGGYFTAIVIPPGMQASVRPSAPELTRVLAPEGRLLQWGSVV